MIRKFLRDLGFKMPTSVFAFLMSFWRPFRGAGIKVAHISPDFRHVKVVLKRKNYNKNYVGTQFGGSIYSMTDPFYMLMLMKNLGREYIVWDKGATIDFVSPGKTALSADFHIDDQLLNHIKEKTSTGEKYIFDLPIEVLDSEGQLVATIAKKLYTRKKPHYR